MYPDFPPPGMRLHYTATPTRYSAGVYLLLAADDVVLPANSSHVDINLGCNYTSPDINVFAFRTHAHTHATRVRTLYNFHGDFVN